MLPIYNIVLNDDNEGMYAIALVASPATECSWAKFSEQKKVYCSIDEENRRIITVIMRADYPIYRYDGKEEFYVVFQKDTIEKMAQKFLRDNCQTQINIEHTDYYIDGFEMVQMFIKNTEKGLSPKGFEDIEEGSLFGVYNITNNDLWDAIKAGKFTSVSLEGFFSLDMVKEKDTISTIEELLEEINK